MRKSFSASHCAILLALGRRNPDDASEPFNMAYLATRGSGAVNGVSRLHGQVSRRIFQVLFPRWPEREVPVSHVTNGVHVPTWESPDADKLWAGVCGAERWMGDTACLDADFRKLTDAQLWQLRMNTTKGLIEYTRTRPGPPARNAGSAGGGDRRGSAHLRHQHPDAWVSPGDSQPISGPICFYRIPKD